MELLRTRQATAILCTPSYALHLAEVAAEHQIDVGELDVRQLILAGEPGGSMPAIRGRIEAAWKARVLDHSGATEVGPWGYGDLRGQGLYVNENDFIAEFLSVETGTAAAEGELSELVLTNLGRVGSPIIRYRTGDLVRPSWQHAGANRFVFLEGGVLSRADDMMVIRGVNVFPSSIEQILRSFPEVVEYRMTARKQGEMDQLVVEIEDRLNEPDARGRRVAAAAGPEGGSAPRCRWAACPASKAKASDLSTSDANRPATNTRARAWSKRPPRELRAAIRAGQLDAGRRPDWRADSCRRTS